MTGIGNQSPGVCNRSSISRPSFPTLVIGNLSWFLVSDGTPIPTCWMTTKVCPARHFQSGIHLAFRLDGSPLTTCGDDDWYAFGFAQMINGLSKTVCQPTSMFLQFRASVENGSVEKYLCLGRDFGVGTAVPSARLMTCFCGTPIRDAWEFRMLWWLRITAAATASEGRAVGKEFQPHVPGIF
jgi:hypothetical protein